MRDPHPKRRRWGVFNSLFFSIFLGGAALSYGLTTRAAPEGGVVSAGQASISTPDASTTLIQQQSTNAVIDWQKFNINSSEKVQFDQPSSQSAILNRIYSGSPSQIFGKLSANGQVFLANPNGIIFAPGAEVNVSSFMATTLNIANEDFMNQRYQFRASDHALGTIINQGVISAASGGFVGLVGNQVRNEGKIVADYGTVMLGAGKAATLDFDGDGLMTFVVSEPVTNKQGDGDTAVENAGSLQANGGRVVLSAKAAQQVFNKVVNNTGVVEAARLVERGGVIHLLGEGGSVFNSGKLLAQGKGGRGGHIEVRSTKDTVVERTAEISTTTSHANSGGTIRVLGERVGIFDQAQLNASGVAGGGEILIGGDYQGKGSVPRAEMSLVGPEAVIAADALEHGSGGKVVVWSDGQTRMEGHITAKGGALGGDGGLVETSGKKLGIDAGIVDTSAIMGKGGLWLLDPSNITIISTGGTSWSGGCGGVQCFTANGTSETFSNTTLSNALASGQNVDIITYGVAGDGGSITVSSPITFSASGLSTSVTLNLDSYDLINVNAPITVTGTAVSTNIFTLNLESGGNIVVNDDITLNGGSLLLQAGFNLAGANTAGLTIGSGVELNTLWNGNSGGDINLSAGSGGITVPATASISTTSSTWSGNDDALTVTLQNGGDATISGPIISSVLAVNGSSAASDFSAVNTSNELDDIGVISATLGNFSVYDSSVVNNALSIGGFTIGGNFALTAPGTDVTIDSNVTVGGSFTLSSSTLQVGSSASVGSLTTNGTTTITTNDGYGTSFINTAPIDTNSNNLSIQATGGLGISNTISASNITMTAPAGQSIGVGTSSSGNMVIYYLNNLDVDTGGTLQIGNANSGAINVNGLSFGNYTMYLYSGNTIRGSGSAPYVSTSLGSLQMTSNGDIGISSSPFYTSVPTLVVSSTNGNSAYFSEAGSNPLSVSVTTGAGTPTVNYQVSNPQSLSIDSLAFSNGSATITNNGAITQTATGISGNQLTLAAGSSNNITLTAVNNSLGTLAVSSANNVNYVDNNALNLGASTIAGTLNVTTSGAITDSGNVNVTGTATFAAGAGNNITLDSNNDFSTVVITTGNNVALTDQNAFNLGASTVSGGLTVNAGGAITDSGAWSAVGAVSLSASGNPITIDQVTSFGSIGFTGSNVSLSYSGGAIVLGDSTISGNFVLTGGGGNITDTGTLTVSGTTTITAGSSYDVTLNSNNNFNSVSIVSADEVTLTDSGSIALGASTISGGLTINAGGSITDTGSWSSVGTASFLSSGGPVTIDNATGFSSIQFNGTDITLNYSAGAIALGASTVTGNMVIVGGGGNITDSGALTIGERLTMTAGSSRNVTLDNANNFNNVVIVSANDVSLTDTGAIDIGANGVSSAISGNFTVNAGGAITDISTWTVAGNATFSSPGNAITLDNIGGFSGIGFTGGNVTLGYNGGAIVLNASTITGNLTVNGGGGSITDNGVLTVSGTTTLAAGSGHNITLDNADNFGTVAVTSANNVTLTDTGAIDLGASTISGTLAVNTNGAITDSGAVNVSGTATFTAGAANNITLDSANDFNTIDIVSGNNVSITDINAVDIGSWTVSGALTLQAGGAITDSGAWSAVGAVSLNAGSNPITINQVTGFGSMGFTGSNVSLSYSAGAITLGNSTISGNFTLTGGGGNISDTGALTVSGATTITAGGGYDVTLDSANDFNSVSVVSADDVTLTDAGAIVLGASTISGNLTLNAGGAITDSGAWSTGGTAVFSAPSNTITIDNATSFSSIGFTGNNIVLTYTTGSFSLGASTISGNLAVTGGGGNITDSGVLSVSGTTTLIAGSANNITLDNADNFNTVLVTSANNVTLTDTGSIDLGASTVSGTLTVNTSGAISDSGTLNVTGLTTLAAGAGNNITLDSSNNNFSTVAIGSGNNVNLTDVNAIILGASTVSGNLNVTAGGDITDSGVLSITGTTTLSAGTANNITLDSANNFNIVQVSSGNNVTLTDSGSIDLGTSTVSGNLTVNAGTAITDSGIVSVGGTTGLTAGTNITLDGANDFLTVTVNAGGNVQLTDANAIILGSSTVGGTLGVTAGTNITDSGVLSVTGITTLNAGSAITLDSANQFSTVLMTSGSSAYLANASALTVGASTVGGALSVYADDGLTVSGNVTSGGTTLLNADADADTVGDFTVNAGVTINTGSSTLTAIADDIILTGSITNTNMSSTLDAPSVWLTPSTNITVGAGTGAGAFSVSGGELDNITVGAGGAVQIGSTTAGALVIDGGVDVGAKNFILVSGSTINDTDDVGSALTTTGTLTLYSNGVIGGGTAFNSNASTVVVLGTGGNNINITATGNTPTTIDFITGGAGNINYIQSANTLSIQDILTTGTVGLTTSGAITQSGAIGRSDSAIGTLTLAAGAGNDITLSNENNNFGTVITSSGNNVSLRDSGAVDLGASTVSGGYTVVSNGAITDSGVLAVTGTATLNAGSANNITLDSANNFSTLGVTAANNVSINDANALDLGASTISGTLTVTTNGAITDSGALNITGNASFSSTGNAITLDTATNNFSTVSFSGSNVSLVDAGALDLGTATATGTLTVQTGGNLTDSGTVSVTGGTTTLNSGSSNVVLDTATNDFSTVVVTSAGDVTLHDTNAFNFGNFTITGNGNIVANGAITDSGTITVGGVLTLESGNANNIILNSAANDFNEISVGSANDVTLIDTNSLTLDNITMQGNLDVNVSGSVLLNGTITSGGTQAYHDPVTISSNSTLSTTNSAVTFDSTVNGSKSLTISSGTATTTFTGAVGATTPVDGLTVTNTTGGQTTFSSSLGLTGTSMLTTNQVNFSGGAGSVTGSGNLIIRPASNNTTMDIGGGSATLNISLTPLNAYRGHLYFGQTPEASSARVSTMTIGDSLSFLGDVDFIAGEQISVGNVSAPGKKVTILSVNGDIVNNTLTALPNVLAKKVVLATKGIIGTIGLDFLIQTEQFQLYTQRQIQFVDSYQELPGINGFKHSFIHNFMSYIVDPLEVALTKGAINALSTALTETDNVLGNSDAYINAASVRFLSQVPMLMSESNP